MAHTPSELASFTYCPLQWKLISQRGGVRAARKRGIESHADLRRRILEARRLGWDTAMMAAYAIIASLGLLAADLTGRTFPSTRLVAYFLFYSLAIVGAVLWALAYLRYRRWNAAQAGLGVDALGVESLDLPWASERHELVGKPDYVAHQEGVPVPVEFKSSEFPQDPWETDVVQLGAYALLMEDAYGERPPFGFIQYRTGQHKVEFTDEFIDGRILPRLHRLQEAGRGAAVGRDHTSPRKCGTCSERVRCPERLA